MDAIPTKKNTAVKAKTATKTVRKTEIKTATGTTAASPAAKVAETAARIAVPAPAAPAALTPVATTRPPIVAIMGHIDHGKSTLLDYIRRANTVDREAGGITQHVAAYEVVHIPAAKSANGAAQSTAPRRITFIDTPGHAAFKGIRARGANSADIAILIVSGEEGVKPQTLEAYQCIKQSNVPFIVAITKMDTAKADIERTKQSLAENEIYVEGYGGDVPWVAISAKSGLNIPELLDTILLVADMAELSAFAVGPAEGIVVEAHRDMRKGISAVVVIKSGTLEVNSCVVADTAVCPVRSIESTSGGRIERASFSTPVRLSGWSEMPHVGAKFQSCNTKRDALEKAALCSILPTTGASRGAGAPTAARTPKAITADGEPCVIIPFVLKADAAGSLEALEFELASVGTPNVRLRILNAGIGNISESDIKTASIEAGSIVVGFNVAIDPQADAAADRMSIRVETFDIIYKLIEWLEIMVKERAPKIMIEEIAGTAKIMKCFSKMKDKQVVGGRVVEGTIHHGDDVRIMRRGAKIGEGKIRELQQQKQRADEAKKDTEFGTMIEAKIEIAPGDMIECVRMVEKKV